MDKLYVYVAHKDGVTKIGRTADIKRRMRELQGYKLCSKLKTSKWHACFLEITTHRILRAMGLTEVRNEYFRCPETLPILIMTTILGAKYRRAMFIDDRFERDECLSGSVVSFKLNLKEFEDNIPVVFSSRPALYRHDAFLVFEYHEEGKIRRLLLGADFALDLNHPNFEEAFGFEIAVRNSMVLMQIIAAITIGYRHLPDVLSFYRSVAAKAA